MTVETRYFRDDEKLGTTQTTTGDVREMTPNSGQGYIGVKVYVDDVCISGAVPVARQSVPPGETPSYISATWLCPNQDNAGIVKVDVYACKSDGSSPQFIVGFASVDSVKLDSATWTVYYFCCQYYDGNNYPIVFYYGKTSRNSRITNFTWSAVAAMVSKRLLVGVGV